MTGPDAGGGAVALELTPGGGGAGCLTPEHVVNAVPAQGAGGGDADGE
jgi:hypothetical protein